MFTTDEPGGIHSLAEAVSIAVATTLTSSDRAHSDLVACTPAAVKFAATLTRWWMPPRAAAVFCSASATRSESDTSRLTALTSAAPGRGARGQGQSRACAPPLEQTPLRWLLQCRMPRPLQRHCDGQTHRHSCCLFPLVPRTEGFVGSRDRRAILRALVSRAEAFDDVFNRAASRVGQGILRAPRGMRGDQRVGCTQHGMVGWQRFFLKYIESQTAQPAVNDRLYRSGNIYQSAARGVDEHGSPRHRVEKITIDRVASALEQWGMETDNVRTLREIGQCHMLKVRCCNRGIDDDNFAAQRLKGTSHQAADSATADQSDRGF